MLTGQKYQACVEALRDFARGTGFDSCVLGLSGGLDSSVAAVMAVDALGADRVHGVLMPGPYSTDHSLSDAHALADALGIETRTVPIEKAYAAFEAMLGGEVLVPASLTSQNVQARCRMVVLMALSNRYGWMVVNTGNKTEACMGYSTLYGDAAGAFAPLGGLYKADVYAVGRWRNQCAREAGELLPIPENVFIKPPSAELAPDQSDEESLGIDYPTLDAILMAVLERGETLEQLAASGYVDAQVQQVLSRYRAAAFKRALLPPSPAVDFYGEEVSR